MGGDTDIGRDWDLLVWWLQEGTKNPRGLVLIEVPSAHRCGSAPLTCFAMVKVANAFPHDLRIAEGGEGVELCVHGHWYPTSLAVETLHTKVCHRPLWPTNATTDPAPNPTPLHLPIPSPCLAGSLGPPPL